MEYLSVLERRAERRGKLEGKIEGKIEGKLEGKIEGKLEGKIEGKLEGKVEMLLRLLTRKFNELPPAFVERLKAIDDGQRLDELFDLALCINSLEELPI